MIWQITVRILQRQRARHAGGPDQPSAEFGRLRSASREVKIFYQRHLDRFTPRLARGEVGVYVMRYNKFVEEQKPWSLAKKTLSEHKLDEVLYHPAGSLRITAILISRWYRVRRTQFSISSIGKWI